MPRVPRIVVIMPAYQAAATLRSAILSIVHQSFADWELVVMDDASHDETVRIAKEIAAMDRRIKVLRHTENLGAAVAMNRAAAAADSEFVAIMDADDVALDHRLERQVEFLRQHREVTVAGGAAHFVDGGGRFLRTVRPPPGHEELTRRRWYQSPFVHSTVMMRRPFLEATGGYMAGLRLGEDYDLWMRGFADGRFRYANLAEPLLIYRTRPVQRWKMIRASVGVRFRAGRREGRRWRGGWAAARILAEGAVELTGIFAWRDRVRPAVPPPEVSQALLAG